MPGILPMKVIQVGSNAHSRIAQACDRCRSKKIRCDGIRPCCSQCAHVGFECRTSDKLSRRAFPRGYTESLEERVRALEGEVRELKDLLDEKDEKIDMLSNSSRYPSMSASASPSLESRRELFATPPQDDVFRVHASPVLFGAENADSYLAGASSGRAFVEAFIRRIQERGKPLARINTEGLLHIQGEEFPLPRVAGSETSTAPPRMFSDRWVNVFFQEWAPLFPVLHKPTFLRLYEEYMSTPEHVTEPHTLAQLHLVFGIAGISSDLPDKANIALVEDRWRQSLESVLMDNTFVTLQCLVLAIMYCTSKADYTRLQHYKSIAVGLSHRLGLHQSQKRFSFGALATETRKKVFWTLYTLDCFSAALLGLPKLLKEEDIHAEYPSSTDEEHVTEKGLQPTIPGESTKISSALALFRVSRILSRVLDQSYPAAAVHDLSLHSLASLEGELKEWSAQLPTHLKLTFVQDKPSTDITGSRSAILSLAYYHIRSLIHRPAAGSTLGHRSAPSVLSVADSSKHIIQIVQLLDERSMSFSFCLNKNEMLTLCGLSILYQGLDLKQEGRLVKDGQRLVATVVQLLEKAHAPGAADFKSLSFSMAPELTGRGLPGMADLRTSDLLPSPSVARQHLRPQIYRHGSASLSESDLLSRQDKLRRATVPNISPHHEYSSHGRSSVDSTWSEPPISPYIYPPPPSQLPSMRKPRPCRSRKPPNLNYPSLSNTPFVSQPQSPAQARSPPPQSSAHTPLFHSVGSANKKPNQTGVSASQWEALLSSLDGGQAHISGAIHGCPTLSLENACSNYETWSLDSQWYMASLTTNELGDAAPGAARSVLSLSEESLSSGEEMSSSDVGLGGGHDFAYEQYLMGAGQEYSLEGLGATFGL
ncbi:transcription factor Cys [Marssonina coronariae]|uniref:Transcription factor Cys n=1 Tax=Diplocarpon coronariae TaxID=2795749 RepID=A0A218YTS4_9HELO|nr:transcription factor Cys [Marssonina coronariae]